MTNFERFYCEIIKYDAQWCKITDLRGDTCTSNCKNCKKESEKWLLAEYEPQADCTKAHREGESE